MKQKLLIKKVSDTIFIVKKIYVYSKQMRISNTKKKELSEIFRNHNLNLFDFEISGEYHQFKIKFKYDYFSFLIEQKTHNEYNFTIYPIDNTKGLTVGGTWENAKSRFNTWCQQIKTELNTPTGWESFQSENFLDAGFDDLDAPFSENEKLQIRQGIKEVKERIITLELPERSIQTMVKKLDELCDKVDELNKFDWKSFFIGTMASLIMTLSIPPEMQGIIWECIKMAFRLKLH
jgi:hypothetical protein